MTPILPTPRQKLITAFQAWVQDFDTDIDADVVIGVPKFFSARLTCYIAFASPDVVWEGFPQQRQDILIGFGYDVEDQSEDAELTLGLYVDTFMQRYYADRATQAGPFDPNTNGHWAARENPDGSINGLPQYLNWSNAEVRNFVFVVQMYDGA